MRRSYLLGPDALIRDQKAARLFLWRSRRRTLDEVEVFVHRDGYSLLMSLEGEILGIELGRSHSQRSQLTFEIGLDDEEARLFGRDTGFSYVFNVQSAPRRQLQRQEATLF